MNNYEFESVSFLNNKLKNKLLNKTIPMLDMLHDKLGSRGCDDLSETDFNETELILLNMEFCKHNGSIHQDIKDGMFTRPLGSESSLVLLAKEVLSKYIIENAGYDEED